MRHFSIDARTLTKKQFKALKAVAKAAGLCVRYWRWSDREEFPIMSTQTTPSGNPAMRAEWAGGGLVHVPYPEAMRRLSAYAAEAAEAAQPNAPLTPAQEAGFEVEDLAVVVKKGSSFEIGSIVRLERDDGSELPRWELIDGGCSFPSGIAYANLSRLRKLTNVKVA